MKNFFKKLSFVLAVAMVLTSLTPATASAASKNFVTLKGSKTAVTSVYAWIGGVTRNLDYNINGKTSGVKGTWKSSKEEFVKVDAKTGVITPVANGSAYVTFTTADGKTTVKTVVKARTRAAALHIYDKAEYAAGNKVQLENKEGVTPSAIELKVGETKDLRITMPLSKKQQDAGAKIASYYTYAEVADNAVVEAAKDAEGNERAYTLTAKAVGETTVTIVANQTTQANVRTGKYFKEATINVKVVDAFSVKQTGANKITVTGTDLTDKTADYVVKRGNSVVTLKSVASLNESKTEAVLEASATNLVAGNYTLSFKEGEAYEFPVEAAVVSSIEILSDVAVLHPDYTTQATARYQVKNQFGEDITANSNLAGSTKLTISPSDAKADFKTGIVTFTSNSEYRPNVDVVALTIVCNTNGVNAQKTLTVSNKAVLDTVEFVGVYTTNKTGTLEKADLKEKTAKKDVQKYFALFSGKNQYGEDYNTPSNDGKELNVVISGVPGLMASTSAGAITTKTVNNVKYLAVQLTSAYDHLNAGTCDVLAIPTMSGKTSTAKIDVVAVAKIDTIAIATSEVLGGEANELEYDILDTEGNRVTSYEVIMGSGIFYNANGTPKIDNVTVERKDDGTAKIIYTAAPNTSDTDAIVTFTIMSETNKVTLVRLNVQKNPEPQTITAVNKVTSGGNLGVLSGNSLTIDVKHLTILDQHGNAYSVDKFTADKQATIKVEVSNEIKNAVTGPALNTTGVAISSKNDNLITITGSGVNGTIKFVINGKEEGSCTLNLISTSTSNVDSDVTIKVPAMMYQGSEHDLTVEALVGGAVTKLEAGKDYFILDHKGSANNKIKAPDLATGSSVEITEKVFTVTVTVNGKDYKQEVKYSNATPVVGTAFAREGAKLTVPSPASVGITLSDLANMISVMDQYGSFTNGVTTSAAIRANVAKVGTNNATIENNNTSAVKITGATAGDVFDVTYSFEGTSYTFKTRVKVSAAE